MLRKILNLLFVLLLGTTLSSDLMAQGRIVGFVFDDTESVIPGADVTATHDGTNVSYSFQSNASGKYEFPSLPVGQYTIRVELAGFKASEARIIVETAQVTQQDITLEVGALQDTVTVSAEAQAPLLQAESPEIGQVITNRQILELPLNGRNFEQLALLSTGVVGYSGSLVVMNGARPTQTFHQIDNMSTNTILDGRNQVRPSIETIQEFKLQSSTFSAEGGRAPGILNVTTRSGSNQFHGNFYNFFRNDHLAAFEFFQKQRANPRKSPLNRNQFGATLGGPIVRNKNFFFSNFESLRQYRGQRQNLRAPTPLEKAGDFSQTPGVLIVMDLMARLPPGFPIPFAPFPGNSIPASRAHPTYEYFRDWWPEPNDVSGFRYIAAPRGVNNSTQFSHRADHHFSSADRIWARYFFTDAFNRNPGWGTRPDLIGGAKTDTRTHQFSAAWNHTFSPRLLLDVSGGFMSAQSWQNGNSVCFQEDGCTNHAVEAGFGGMEFGSKFFPGTPAILVSPYAQDFNWASPLRNTIDNMSIKAKATWITGKHSIRGGIDFLTQTLRGESPTGARGIYLFNGLSTGFANPWSDFVLGVPALARRSAPRTRGGAERDSFQFFLQDDFKITTRLTLNLGMRYDYNFAPVPVGSGGAVDLRSGKIVFADFEGSGVPSPDFAPALPFLLPLIGEENLISTTQAGLHPSFVNLDKNNIAPRIGLAWRPFDKTVLRAGYGLYYLLDIVGNIAVYFGNHLPFTIAETQSNLTAFFLGLPFKTVSNMFTNFDELTAIPPDAWQAIVVNPKTHTPYENHYSFSIQQQFERNLVFEVMYVGKTSVHLQSNRPVGLPPDRPAFVPSWATMVTQEANSSYHSLQSRLEKRYSGGLAFLGSYTWSKAIDIGSGNLDNPGAVNAQRGLADYDVPHRFVFSATYDLPFGRDRRWLSSSSGIARAVLGGWQLTAISQYQSGRAYSVAWQGGNTGAPNIPIAARPDRIRDGRKDNPTIEEWFDVSAFEPHMKPPNPDAPGTFLPEEGNAGRNILRGPSIAISDIGINKNFYWGPENRYRLQFRAELFNAFNTPVFGSPQGASPQGGGTVQIGTNPNAARINRTAGPTRQVQFALKLYY